MSDIDLQSDFISLDVGPDMTLNDIKAFIEAEINVPPSAQHFIQDGRPVTDTSKSLAQMNVQEGDVLAMAIQSASRASRRPAQEQGSSQPAQRLRSGNDPEQARLRILGDPVVLAECQRQDPELAAACSDAQKFRDLWNARQRQYEQVQREKEEQFALLEADPFNVEAQQKIEEIIRQQRVAENLQKAMEENPECRSILIDGQCWRQNMLTRFQPLAELPCCTSTSRSTMFPSKRSWIPARKPPSCLPRLPNDAESFA